LPKPFKVDEMRSVIADALQLKQERTNYKKSKEGPLYFGCLIGESPAMCRIYELIERVAVTSSNVLISGESGTGKELVARAIHRQSPRANHPFIAVNCGGVPESLIESEMFGYKKGSFTGAASTRKGLVEAAEGGTLFLDEISELSPSLQVKLLRLVQEKTVRMVGGTEDTPVDVRIIAATNRDLEMMVIEGSFREDLYHRLNVLPINMPPLRERRQDIPLLADFFLCKFRQAFNKDVRKLSSYAMDILKEYDFPGNIRELENIIERGVVLEASNIILPDSLTLANFKKKRGLDASTDHTMLPSHGMDLDHHLAQIERSLLVQALQMAHGIKLKAAELLGISFRSMRYRLIKYGLAGDDEQVSGDVSPAGNAAISHEQKQH
jgi:two-component system, NtrC family, response regulator PilR